jgi:hypothetical protein
VTPKKTPPGVKKTIPRQVPTSSHFNVNNASAADGGRFCKNNNNNNNKNNNNNNNNNYNTNKILIIKQ